MKSEGAVKGNEAPKRFKDFFLFQATPRQKIDDEFLEKLHKAYKNRWTMEFIKESKAKKALTSLCEERIEVFRKF